MKKSLEIPPSEDDSRREQRDPDVEELVRKYEEHRDKKCDSDLKLQRLYDIFPKPTEQQLVLDEDTDGSATYESLKRRANNWKMTISTGRADMDLGMMGNRV